MDFQLFAALLPGLLLVTVAIHHRWRMWRYGQLSWKGGGFAMFSDASDNSPITEVWTIDSDGRRSCFQVSDGNHARLLWARTIPTPRHMTAWAHVVAETAWQKCGTGVHPLQPHVSTRVPIQRIVVRDRRVTLDATTGAYRATERASYEVVLTGASRSALR